MKRYLLMLSLWLAGLGCLVASATEHLVMIGGGSHPPEAVKRFADWARTIDREDPRILVVGWAGGKAPGEEPVAIEEELAQLGIKSLERAPHSTEVGKHKELL